MAFYLPLPVLDLAIPRFSVPVRTAPSVHKQVKEDEYRSIIKEASGGFTSQIENKYIICIQIYLSSNDTSNTTPNSNSRCVRNVAELIITTIFPVNAVDVVKGIQAEAELLDNIPRDGNYADVYIFLVK